MGRKVKVVTACGEEYFYDYPQDVESVEIVEEEKHLIITKQDDFDGAGHWHLEDKNGRCMGNIFIEGKEVDIHPHYKDVHVKVY